MRGGRLIRAAEGARALAPFAIPAALAAWAVAVSWSTPQAPAKVMLALAVAWVLAQGRRWPFLALISAFAGLFGVGSLDAPLPEDAFLAMVVTGSYLVGRHGRLTRQPWAAAGVLLLLASNLMEPGRDVAAADVVFPVLLTAGPWLLGISVQLSVRREEAAIDLAGRLHHTRAEEVRRATTEERMRIAQEFHDVVAHDITGLSLQAQLLRRNAEAGGAVTAGELGELERTAQQAMNDVRRLLQVLRPDADNPALAPVDGFERVPELVDAARRLGQQVSVGESGQARELPPALSAAAYRIVQEALTNARRHGSGGPTRLDVDWREDMLSIRVANPCVDRPGQQRRADGHGLPGIQERARLFGGRATVGEADGRWVVEAELPTPVSRRAAVP